MRYRRFDQKSADCAYRIKFGWLKQCVYCGDPATTQDHVMPISITARTEFWRPAVRAELAGGLWLVPCCNECNVLAGATPFRSILAKRAFVKAAIKKKYAKYSRGVLWEEDELAELGHTLRTKVLHDL